MRKLTEKQRSLLTFIERFIAKEGMAPTVYEISEHFAIKTSTVFAHLRALQKKGQIARSSKARSITVLHQTVPRVAREILSLPLLGEDSPRLVPVTRSICDASLREGFAFRVKDDSMHRSGIFSGDLLVAVPKTPLAGDLVAVELAGRMVVRSGYPGGDRIELRTAPASGDPARSSIPMAEVRGVVMAMIRKF